jgi:hypothetical protein
MCYESITASAGGDEATLAKSLIISLEDTASNWYLRLPPKCIYSLQQLKEKFLLDFQGFHVELSTEEDFLSCTQYEKETLPNFYWRFLQLKAQTLDVLNDQVITQAINALRARPLHSHLVREQPKIVAKLYEEFAKFSKSEVLHFRKLEQQRKAPKHDEAPRPPGYNDNQRTYPKQVHNIDSNSRGPSENWEKNFGPPPQEKARGALTTHQISTAWEGACQAKAAITVEAHTLSSLRIACTMVVKSSITQKIVPFSSSPKEKWSKTPSSLCNNHQPEKWITQCNGHHLTTCILHPTLCSTHRKLTQTTTTKLRHITNPITMPPPIILSSANPTNNIPSASTTNHLSNSNQNQPAKQARNQPTSTTNLRASIANWKFSHPWHNSHNYQRL